MPQGMKSTAVLILVAALHGIAFLSCSDLPPRGDKDLETYLGYWVMVRSSRADTTYVDSAAQSGNPSLMAKLQDSLFIRSEVVAGCNCILYDTSCFQNIASAIVLSGRDSLHGNEGELFLQGDSLEWEVNLDGVNVRFAFERYDLAFPPDAWPVQECYSGMTCSVQKRARITSSPGP
jgi:hypothetical protein